MKLVFSDQEFSNQLTRIIGATPEKAADIEECLNTAEQIKESDFGSWYEEWLKTADRVNSYGEESLAAGHNVSAREAFLRASSYYRAAEFFIHENPDDPRIIETWSKSRDAFRKAGELLNPPFEPIRVPYEDTYLHGYFFKVDEGMAPLPTLILNTGFDGTSEELYLRAAGAVRRGYNCLVIDGPGQGQAIREQNIHFRPDWEKVVTPIVDFLLSRPDVNPDKIALMGLSLGGYFAPRAAAFDHRLAACIANSGVYNMLEGILAPMGQSPEETVQYAKENPEELDKAMYEEAKKSTNLRWGLSDGMWKFGVSTPHEWLLKTSEYNLKGVSEKITCPTAVCDSENDMSFPGQAKNLFDELTCPKTFLNFTSAEGAGEHCQSGALILSDQRVFDWLDETLSIRVEAAA